MDTLKRGSTQAQAPGFRSEGRDEVFGLQTRGQTPMPDIFS